MSAGLLMTAAIAVYLLVCVVWARIRGVTRSRIRLVTVIFSAVLAFVGTLVIKNLLSDDSLKAKLYELAASSGMDFVNDLAGVSAVVEDIVLKTSGALLAPMIFFLLFTVFSLVTWVLYFVVTLLLFVVIHRKEKSRKFKGIPCLIHGLIQGALCVAVTLVPVSTYFSILPKITDQIAPTLPEDQKAAVEQISAQAESVNKSPAVFVFRTAGGKLVCSAFTDYSVKTEGGEKIKVKLESEIESIIGLISDVKDLSGKPMGEYTAEDAEAISALGESVGKSKIVSVLASELVHGATGAWKEGDSFLGLSKPTADDMTGPMLEKLIDILYAGSETTVTFNEDIQTLTKLMAKLIEKDVMQSMSGGDSSALITKISQEGVIKDVALILGANERMKVLIPELTTLSVKILAQSIGIPENDEAVYTDMLTSVADKLNELKNGEATEAEKISIMEDTLDAEFKKAGLDIEPEYVSAVADALVKDFGDSEVVIDPIFISEFFEIYANRIEAEEGGTVGGIAYNGGALFEKFDGEAGENGGNKEYTYYKYKNNSHGSSAAALGNEHRNNGSSSSQKLASLKNSQSAGQSFNSLTIDKLFGDSGNSDYGSYSDEDIKKEAEALEKLLGCAGLLGSGASTNEIIKGVGEALDGLSDTESFGKENTNKLFGAIIGSDKVGDMLTDEEKQDIMDSLAGSDDLSYEELMNGVSGIISLVEALVKDGSATIDIEVAKDLIRSLTEANVSALDSLIKTERLSGIGIPEDKLDASISLIKSLLMEIGKFGDDSSIDSEAKAVKQMIDIALTAKGGEGSTLFGEDGRLGCTADEMVSVIMTSTAVRNTLSGSGISHDPFGLALNGQHKIIKAEREQIEEACRHYYNTHRSDVGVDAVELKNELKTLASILGITIEI